MFTFASPPTLSHAARCLFLLLCVASGAHATSSKDQAKGDFFQCWAYLFSCCSKPTATTPPLWASSLSSPDSAPQADLGGALPSVQCYLWLTRNGKQVSFPFSIPTEGLYHLLDVVPNQQGTQGSSAPSILNSQASTTSSKSRTIPPLPSNPNQVSLSTIMETPSGEGGGRLVLQLRGSALLSRNSFSGGPKVPQNSLQLNVGDSSILHHDHVHSQQNSTVLTHEDSQSFKPKLGKNSSGDSTQLDSDSEESSGDDGTKYVDPSYGRRHGNDMEKPSFVRNLSIPPHPSGSTQLSNTHYSLQVNTSNSQRPELSYQPSSNLNSL